MVKDETKTFPKGKTDVDELELRRRIAELPEITIEPQ